MLLPLLAPGVGMGGGGTVAAAPPIRVINLPAQDATGFKLAAQDGTKASLPAQDGTTFKVSAGP